MFADLHQEVGNTVYELLQAWRIDLANEYVLEYADYGHRQELMNVIGIAKIRYPFRYYIDAPRLTGTQVDALRPAGWCSGGTD